jgi:hypothetical protein
MTGEHWIGMDLEGRGRDLTAYYLRIFLEVLRKTMNAQSRWPMSKPKFVNEHLPNSNV